MFSSVLQGPGEAEEVSCPDQTQTQNHRIQHSFVQEHFQAQYKWVSFLSSQKNNNHHMIEYLVISVSVYVQQLTMQSDGLNVRLSTQRDNPDASCSYFYSQI